jgi:hypothetical protein
MIKYTIKRGDNVPITVYYQLDGVAVNIDGYTPVLAVKQKISDTAYIFTKSGTAILPATNGIALVTLTAAETATACKNAVMEAVLVDGSGNQFTYGEFLLDIADDVYK